MVLYTENKNKLGSMGGLLGFFHKNEITFIIPNCSKNVFQRHLSAV